MRKFKQKNRKFKRYIRKQSKKALLEKEQYFQKKLINFLKEKGLPQNYFDFFSGNTKVLPKHKPFNSVGL